MSQTPPAHSQQPRVLILSQDLIGPQMAGPGIRYWELSHTLAHTCDVTLAAPLKEGFSSLHVDVRHLDLADPHACDDLLDAADVIISNGFLLYHFPSIEQSSVPWVVDAYIPTPTEGLAHGATRPMAEQEQAHTANTEMLHRIFARGDFFVCANERQRDLYLGFLSCVGRLNPQVYTTDPTARSLVDVVPFGLRSERPIKTRQVLKGVRQGVSEAAQMLLWGGGIWDWLDPLTLIEALAGLVSEFPQLVAYFPGTRHPFREHVPDMAMRRRAMELGARLGLTDKHLFFGDWMPHADRANYLLEADIGVSMHFASLETRFSFRTRVLDYIWAGLPMVLSAGDSLAELVATRGLGYVVVPGDVESVQEALAKLLREANPQDARRTAFAETAAEFTWERVAQPLVTFCTNPQPAADRAAGYRLPKQRPTEPEADSHVLEAALARQSELEQLLTAYQSGRFMRTMAWLQRQRQRRTSRKPRP